jgi:hypothetical protein
MAATHLGCVRWTLGMLAAVLLASCASVPNPPRQAAPLPSKTGGRVKYAVLINGDDSEVHEGNVIRAYKTLRAHGFFEENIFILSTNNPRPQVGLRIDTLVTSEATRRNLDAVIDRLAKVSTRNDLVLFYATGHGDRIDDECWLALALNKISHRSTLYSSDRFRQEIPRIPSATTVILMDQCYSGGFATRFKDLADTTTHIIAMTDTDERHETYCGYFAETFWSAFDQMKYDTNGDGVVSLKEAYEAAMVVHRQKLWIRLVQTAGQYVCTGGVQDAKLD